VFGREDSRIGPSGQWSEDPADGSIVRITDATQHAVNESAAPPLAALW
jgi:hypothetical protein